MINEPRSMQGEVNNVLEIVIMTQNTYALVSHMTSNHPEGRSSVRFERKEKKVKGIGKNEHMTIIFFSRILSFCIYLSINIIYKYKYEYK